MSAIFGVFHLNNEPVKTGLSAAIMDKLAVYPADRSEVYEDQEFFFACRHQTITPESILEKLPYHEEDTGLTVTADAIIDNRAELLASFGIDRGDWTKITDSQLILMAYKKWRKRSPEFLIGDYAFAIFDRNKQELFCARDHVGKRTLYFTFQSNVFAFCTLMKPLLAVPGVGAHLNDLWIAGFLAIPTVVHELDSSHTLYRDIQQLPPASYITVNKERMQKHRYWEPLKQPSIRLKTDAEYVEAFREIFFEAVHCRLRSLGGVGVLLSGGLDSGSVACVATRKLGETGKDLQAFSALPMEGYQEWLQPGFVADESAYIETMQQRYPNLKVTYCRSEGKHSLTDAERFLEILEQPYKIVENIYWMNHLTETAARKGCKVLLDGQYGNSTISYGDFYTQAYTLYKQARIIPLLKEISAYAKINGIARKKLGKYLLKSFLPGFLHRDSMSNTANLRSLTLLSPELAARSEVHTRLEQAGYLRSHALNYTVAEVRRQSLNSTAFSHIGAIETKVSMAYGLVKRDPTRDKRVIEFCYRIPGDQYVKNGQERVLIRRAMEEILPDKVRLNTREKGIQSADWLQRIAPIWEEAKSELKEMIWDESIQMYLNPEEIMKLIRENQKLSSKETNETDIRLLIIYLIFGKFLKL